MDVTRRVVGMVLMCGVVVLALTLMNWRDRRASRLRQTVLDQLALPELRGRVGVHIQSAILSRRCVVLVDLLAGAPREVWHVFIRLASRLPRHVRLVVQGAADSGCMPAFALETTTGHLLACASRMALVSEEGGFSISRMTAPAPRGGSSMQRGRMADWPADWE